MIRVVVVEDSPTARALLVEILTRDPDIHVVGEAETGMDAVELAMRLRPDLVTMDIEMPVMNGLEATRQIMARAPVPIVVVSSSSVRRETNLALDAIKAGALCVVRKPDHPRSAGFAETSAELLATVRAMAQVKVVRRSSSRVVPEAVASMGEAVVVPPRTRVIAIAASTGGPAALQRIVGRLPASFPAPVLVVQHIAGGFGHAFATWLAGDSRLRVKVGEHGEPLNAGTVYIAPDDHQFGVNRSGKLQLDSGPPIGGFRPSATHLFDSVARVYGAAATAIILTGMGRDGVDGLRRVHAAGGRVLAQDELSSVVYGMPREAVIAGVAHAVLDPDAIADRIIHYVNGTEHGNHNPRR